MEIKYVGNELDENLRQGIFELLTECDADFCPPLSARKSSTQKGLLESDGSGIPMDYFNTLLEQKFLLALEDGKLTGFLTFREHYTCPELMPETDTIYMTTLCVSHSHRGAGISGRLFDLIEREVAPMLGCRVLTARTWSTNGAQMHILPRRGYCIRAVLPDDRGPGIDTVYFQKNI